MQSSKQTKSSLYVSYMQNKLATKIFGMQNILKSADYMYIIENRKHMN